MKEEKTHLEGKGPTAEFLIEYTKKCNGAKVFIKGFKAFFQVKGLLGLYLLGLTITLCLAALIFYFLYVYLYMVHITDSLNTLVFWLRSKADFLKYVMYPFTLSIQIMSLALIAYLSVKIAVAAMFFWVDFLIEKIIKHFRSLKEQKFSLKRMLKTSLFGFLILLKSLCFASVFFLMSFLPFIGILFAFLGISRSAGIDILSPYIVILADYDKDEVQKFSFKNWNLVKSGGIQGVINMIPFLGWIMLAPALMLQIIGCTYFFEEQWKNHKDEFLKNG